MLTQRAKQSAVCCKRWLRLECLEWYCGRATGLAATEVTWHLLYLPASTAELLNCLGFMQNACMRCCSKNRHVPLSLNTHSTLLEAKRSGLTLQVFCVNLLNYSEKRPLWKSANPPPESGYSWGRMWEAAGHLLRQKVALLCASSQLIKFTDLLYHNPCCTTMEAYSSDNENSWKIRVCPEYGKLNLYKGHSEVAGLWNIAVCFPSNHIYLFGFLAKWLANEPCSWELRALLKDPIVVLWSEVCH